MKVGYSANSSFNVAEYAETGRIGIKRHMKNIIRIAITGGPCAGKTKAIRCIKEHFAECGYTVLVAAETATELLSGGITPSTCSGVREFQKYVLSLQLAKGRIFEEAAKSIPAEDVLILYDRGTMDGKAYLSKEEFSGIAEELKTTESELIGCYDAVFHLISVAKRDEKLYSCESNRERMETAPQAAVLDDKVKAAWSGHPYLKVIETAPTLEEKQDSLIREIETFLSAR